MPGIIGIEIGSSTIKLLEVIKKGKGHMVKRYSLLPMPSACLKNGVISEPEALRKIIATELKDKRYKAKKAVCVVQSSQMIIRQVEMEKYPVQMMAQILEIKAEDFLPVNPENYQIDFKITGEVISNEGVKNNVRLVAVPNEVVVPIVKLVESLKLRPVRMTIPSEALESIFYSPTEKLDKKTDNVMILDVGGQATTVTIIEGNSACLTRMIEYGVEHLNAVVRRHKHAIAEENKVNELAIMSVIRAQLDDNIVSEVEQILQFYEGNYGERVRKIYLVGGGGMVKGLREGLREVLNIPTEVLNHFESIVEAPGVDFESYGRFFANLLGAVQGV